MIGPKLTDPLTHQMLMEKKHARLKIRTELLNIYPQLMSNIERVMFMRIEQKYELKR